MYQEITIVGNLGREPEMRFTVKGVAMTSFSVAANRNYNGTTETTWFNVTIFGKQAEACKQYLDKGSLVLVVGRLQPDENGNPTIYTRKDGSHGANFDVTARWVQFLTTTDKKAEPERERRVPF